MYVKRRSYWAVKTNAFSISANFYWDGQNQIEPLSWFKIISQFAGQIWRICMNFNPNHKMLTQSSMIAFRTSVYLKMGSKEELSSEERIKKTSIIRTFWSKSPKINRLVWPFQCVFTVKQNISNVRLEIHQTESLNTIRLEHLTVTGW